MFTRAFTYLAAIALVSFASNITRAADIADRAASECGQCHQLKGPASDDVEQRAQRKGPPLFYAGNKFREPWLVKWLQAPTTIRPAGDFPPAHAKESADGDTVDIETLPKHVALDKESATQMAAYLMTLSPHTDLIEKENYVPGKVPERLGAMDFTKFKGCGACHRDTEKYGGVSGPELYTAWQRLNPAFIVSYIRNPTAWEPRSLMPVKDLQTPQIHKLVDYLHVIGEKEEKPE